MSAANEVGHTVSHGHNVRQQLQPHPSIFNTISWLLSEFVYDDLRYVGHHAIVNDLNAAGVDNTTCFKQLGR